jgi:RNA polymerase sigma-70 factor (ECF subfamily)
MTTSFQLGIVSYPFGRIDSSVRLDFRLASARAPCYGAVLCGGEARVPDSPGDLTLVQAIARRDKDAFEQLYRRHSALLFALGLKILGDRADAEDVLQDTFIQIWKTAESYDSNRGKALGWLIMLTRSRAIDRLRSRGTRARATEAAGLEPRDDGPLPGQRASASETQRIVRGAIDALPAEQRTPIELAYFWGLTQTEIAQRLGQPLGTVKTRMRAAMLRLREQLHAVSQEGGAG